MVKRKGSKGWPTRKKLKDDEEERNERSRKRKGRKGWRRGKNERVAKR